MAPVSDGSSYALRRFSSARACNNADVTSAISYARASQDRTGEELSVERQLEDQRALTSTQRWDLAAEIKDNDVSAAGRRRRPGFEQALQMVRERKADMIVATDMSRLTRGKARDEVRLLELGLEVGLKLSFVRAPDLDLSTAAGRLTASILIAAARHEIEQKSERQQRAALQAAQQGRRIGGRRPFGYEADGTVVREPEAAALREAYGSVLAGVTLAGVARDWNARGLFTPQAGYAHGCQGTCDDHVRPRACPQHILSDEPSRWTAQTVRPVLLNPRYAGLRARGRGKEQQIMSVAQWPAIVAESTWRAGVAVISDPARAKVARGGQQLLSGVGRCGIPGCGATVHGGAAPARRGRSGWRTYRCRAAYGHVGRSAEPVEEYVAAVVIERLSRPDAQDLLLDRGRTDVDKLRGEALALRQRRRGLVSLVADGSFTEDEVRENAAQLAEQIATIEAQLTDAGRVDILGPLIKSPDVAAAWDQLSVDRRRAVIDTLMVVTVHPPGRGTRTFRPETVGIKWR